MLLFLDTEFTGLNQPDPKLFSLAMVPADGRLGWLAWAEAQKRVRDCNFEKRFVGSGD